MTLGQRLKELRINKNLTLRELATRADTDFTYLSKIENGKTDRPPSEDLLRRLAAQLDANPDELIGLSGELPKDIREAISGNTQALSFLRSAVRQDLRPEDWEKLKAQLLDDRKDSE